MSVFRVKLNNAINGSMDVNSLTGVQNTTSIQRTMDVVGPNLIHRHLVDGQTFTDCNYWKQFAYPQVTLADAFIEVVTDDGSVWSKDSDDNVYPVVWLPGTAGVIGAGAGPSGTNMALDIISTYGGPAKFVQIKNNDGSHSVKVRLNGSTSAVFTLDTSSTQIFNDGDIVVSKIEFDNSASGTSAVNSVEVILSVKSVSNS
jgi:hypothetical protein